MKRNVDLTTNSDFSENDRRTLFTSVLNDIHKTYPWSFTNFGPIKSSYELLHEQLFLTGFVKDIRRMKQYEYQYSNSCDRCGRKFKDKPWDRQYCLCGKCAEELENDIQLDRFPYKERISVYQDYLNTTSDRVVLELNYR